MSKSVHPQGFQERNLGRLNPVSALNRVSDIKAWHRKLEIDALSTIDLTCRSLEGIPFGVDADILFAVQTAYQLQGRPEDRVVRLTMAQLCELSSLPISGHSYQRIEQGLERMRLVDYKAESCWGIENKKGWRFWSNAFGLIEDVMAKDNEVRLEDSNQFTANTVLEIALNRNVVPSMRQGHIRALSYQRMDDLTQPMSRLLYRILEEIRLGSQRYAVPLSAWAEHLGLIELDPAGHEVLPGIPATTILKPARIRRALQPAHDDLIRVGYLKQVEYVGRGSKAEIVYAFSEVELCPVNQELLRTFANHGVSLPVAEKSIREHGEEAARHALDVMLSRIRAGYSVKHKPGFLMDALKNPAKYPAEGYTDRREPLTAAHTPLNGSKTALKGPRRSPEESEDLTPIERTLEAALVALRTTGLSSQEQQRAADAFLRGQVDILGLIKLGQLSEVEVAAQLSAWEENR